MKRKRNRYCLNSAIKTVVSGDSTYRNPVREERQDMKMRKTSTINETLCDEQLLREIAPIGNIKPHEDYIRTGTGYETCVHIFEFPGMLDDFWLTDVCSFPNSITTIGIETMDQTEVKKNLNKSIEEQGSRKAFAKDFSAYYNADAREKEMQKLFDEISSMGEVIKAISIRIFIAAKTKQALEERVAKTIKALEDGRQYRAGVFINEQEQEWKSIFYRISEQKKEAHAIEALPIKSTLLAAGNAYHYSCLEDEGGDFLGETGCGGNILFNEWLLNEVRVNASAVVMGNQRFGKSTLLKLRIKSRVLRGDYVRVFDVVGEFTDLIRALGGRTLDMSQFIINLLEIFRSGDDENMNYARHLTKLRTSYRFLAPEAEVKEENEFIEAAEELYKQWGLQPDGEKQITGLPAKMYPTFADFLTFIDEKMDTLVSREYREMEKMLVERKLVHLDSIRSNLRTLVNTYGRIFNGHTSVDNMKDVKALSYDISKLKEMDSRIFDLELFNLLSLSWDDAVTNGSLMKKMWEEKKIALEDVAHTSLFIDESHRTVNTTKPFALDLLNIYLREGPKYFCNMWLASHSIRDFVPEGSTRENINKLKILFELAQYKFIFRQDRNVIPLLDKVFQNALTPRQRERIPTYVRGQNTLIISGDKTLDFKVYLSKEDEALFKGGA